MDAHVTVQLAGSDLGKGGGRGGGGDLCFMRGVHLSHEMRM
jgi:hypothetical protein